METDTNQIIIAWHTYNYPLKFLIMSQMSWTDLENSFLVFGYLSHSVCL